MTEEGQGYLYVFDMNGNLLEKKGYGSEWNRNFNGTRASAIINNGKIYITSGTGNIFCFDEATLNVVWQKEFLNEFGSRNVRYGFNESPLIVGDKLILTPGGQEHNIVALNKNDGSLIWSSKGAGGLAAYCSPLYIADNNIVPQVVTMMEAHIVGIDITNGDLLWSVPFKERNSVHPNTPFYKDNTLLCLAPEIGAVMLRFKNGGREVEKMWESDKLDPITGHAMIVGDYIYCSGWTNSKKWFCANRHTGEIMYEDEQLFTGAVIFADGMLYCYTERGEMALVKPNPEKFEVVSRFTIERGTHQHWAHPVIHNGILYVRHGDSLMAYKIK
jgi:outer membrane protein assembly factor BamB